MAVYSVSVFRFRNSASPRSEHASSNECESGTTARQTAAESSSETSDARAGVVDQHCGGVETDGHLRVKSYVAIGKTKPVYSASKLTNANSYPAINVDSQSVVREELSNGNEKSSRDLAANKTSNRNAQFETDGLGSKKPASHQMGHELPETSISSCADGNLQSVPDKNLKGVKTDCKLPSRTQSSDSDEHLISKRQPTINGSSLVASCLPAAADELDIEIVNDGEVDRNSRSKSQIAESKLRNKSCPSANGLLFENDKANAAAKSTGKSNALNIGWYVLLLH